MSVESDERVLRKLYSEIIHGFSLKKAWDKMLYIKHFSAIDNLEIDFFYKEYYDTAVERGIPTVEEQLEQLKKDGLWTKGDENNIIAVGAAINTFVLAKRKAFLQRDIKSINDQTEEQQKILDGFLAKKDYLLGATAEKTARKLVDTFLISRSFYIDKTLTQLLYSPEEFDELDSREINELFGIYNSVMTAFDDLNIRKIALAPFFQNAFYLAENAYDFFGKPIYLLTNHQVQLSVYGNFYKRILSSEISPPDDILRDPQKLEDWHTGKSNADSLLDKASADGNGSSSVSVFGATKEDLKNWGYEQEGISLTEATKKAGGVLDKEAMMKLYNAS